MLADHEKRDLLALAALCRHHLQSAESRKVLFKDAYDDWIDSEDESHCWYIRVAHKTVSASKYNSEVAGYNELFTELGGELNIGYNYDYQSCLNLLEVLRKRWVLDAIAFS